MATTEEVTAVNAAGQLADRSPYRGRAVCPDCGSRELEVRQVLRVWQPGRWSLAGVQAKLPARIAWEYRCASCGTSGAAEPW